MPTLLVCRCGAGMRAADMRRLPPLIEPVCPETVVLDRIVCPVCVAMREQEIAALALPRRVEAVQAVPS